MIETDDRQNARLNDLQHQNAHADQEETREELSLLCHLLIPARQSFRCHQKHACDQNAECDVVKRVRENVHEVVRQARGREGLGPLRVSATPPVRTTMTRLSERLAFLAL